MDPIHGWALSTLFQCYLLPPTLLSRSLPRGLCTGRNRGTKKMMCSNGRTRLFVLGCVLIANQAAFAQTFGAISGDTRDASGGVVAGAIVTAVNLGTNASRTITTNEAGGYSFPSLPPGTYALKVAKAGFKTVVRNPIELQVQQAARVD